MHKNNTARALPDQELRPRLADAPFAYTIFPDETGGGKSTRPLRSESLRS